MNNQPSSAFFFKRIINENDQCEVLHKLTLSKFRDFYGKHSMFLMPVEVQSRMNIKLCNLWGIKWLSMKVKFWIVKFFSLQQSVSFQLTILNCEWFRARIKSSYKMLLLKLSVSHSVKNLLSQFFKFLFF